METLWNWISWIVFGAIAGWVASLITGRREQGLLMNIIAGIVGAVVGGWIWSLFSTSEVTGWNFTSFLIAIVGAIVVLAILNFFQRRK